MSARDDLLAIPDELLRKGRICQAALVHMDFLGGAKRWWTGYGALEAGGFEWQGTGDIIGVSGVDTAFDLSAREVTFDLSATPEMTALALDAKDRVRDRPVTVFCQLFAHDDIDLDGQEIIYGQPIGSPFSLFTGTMQRMPWSASGPSQRTIQLQCEGLFFRKNSPPRGRWTSPDQQARYPGDLGFERVTVYENGFKPRWR